jgi:hypothetical protein
LLEVRSGVHEMRDVQISASGDRRDDHRPKSGDRDQILSVATNADPPDRQVSRTSHRGPAV